MVARTDGMESYRLIFRSKEASISTDHSMAAVTRAPAPVIVISAIEGTSFRYINGRESAPENECDPGRQPHSGLQEG
jgi:hypothetical protein